MNQQERYFERQDGIVADNSVPVRTLLKPGRLQSLLAEDGELGISVAEGALPQFLIAANDAVREGRIQEAIAILAEDNIGVVRKIISRDPSRTDVMFILARLFSDMGQIGKAEEWYSRVIEQESHPFVYHLMAQICAQNPERLSEAVQYSRNAAEAAPDDVWFSSVLGRDLIQVGRMQEGLELLRAAVDKSPTDRWIHSNYLWYLHYLSGQTRETLSAEYRRWGQTHAPSSLAKQSHSNNPDPGRRLRIGYVSPDFYTHSISSFIESVLDGHSRDAVEVYGYGNILKPDATTERFRRKFDHYRDIHGISYEAAARLVEQDQIDILVEIGGHSQNNCLGVLAYKPAPVQVDFGGISTSGMEQIDYRLTDELLDPPHLQGCYVEESICLPGGLASFRPPHTSPLVTPLPAERNGYVTFGSFNNNIKISDHIMSLWAEILKATDKSRLVLKFIAGRDRGVRDHYFRKFAQLGISRERIQIFGAMPHFEHLRLMGQVDIALDTHPYNGCITTMECLWMGVPTVTLVGEPYVSRAGLSVLSRVGLEIFIASTPREYVAKAVAFAGQPGDLAEIRGSLRQRTLGSDLCDPRRLARELEAAYRGMWRRWCLSRGPHDTSHGATPVAAGRQNRLSDGGQLSLSVSGGALEISVSEGALPEFLMRANDAVRAGQIEEAIGILSDDNVDIVRQMVKEDHSRTDVMFVLARLFFDTGQFAKAEEWYERILAREPHALVFSQMAHICARDPTRLSEALQYSSTAVEAESDNAWYRCVLAGSLMQVGRLQEGIELFRKAAEMAPDDTMIGGMLLWNLHYLPDHDQRALFEQYKRLAQIHAPASMARWSHENDPDPERRLRIGCISPDFRAHSTAYAFEPFLDGYDRKQMEVYGYGYVKTPDQTTERLREKFDRYRDVRAMSYDGIADLITEDGIDILVTVGGASQDNCFGVLAYKPAPVQVDFGGIDTSGMQQIGYRMTDSVLDPPNLQKFYVEESVCLPGGVHSFRPPQASPLVAPLPAKRNGHVTFGSFNNNLKINSHVRSLWAEILRANEGSRLILKFRAGSDNGVREYYLQQFEQLGIARDRIEVYGTLPDFEHLQLYSQVDIALDTYPFNGCITTLEGLWMGVPALSLVGDSNVSRVGLSLLSRIGLEAFTASTADEYVGKANAFAQQLDDLAKIRASLRQRMLSSDLCNPKRVGREMGAAFRGMWHRWCRSRGGTVQPGWGGEPQSTSSGRPIVSVSELTDLTESGRKIGQRQPSPAGTDGMHICIPEGPAPEQSHEEALKLGPCPIAYDGLAKICAQDVRRLSEAAQYRRKAVDLDPDNPELRTSLAIDVMRVGRLEEGIDLLRKALEDDPHNADVHSKLLFQLHYLPGQDRQTLFEERKRWGRMHAPRSLARMSHDNVPDPNRRLRVGYISADFRTHSAAFNFEAILAGRDRDSIGAYGYGNVLKPDGTTDRLQQQFDCYRDVRGLSDEEVARLIQRNNIDILVEIAGHTRGNRLGVMAYKPAPIQADYQGVGTTGMEQIDYRFTDAVLDPLDSPKYYVEESIYLPGGIHCYTPPGSAPPVGPLPAARNGCVTFGSFNNNLKINPYVVSLWAEVLRANEKSCLRLKFFAGNDQRVRNHYWRLFERCGIDRARVHIYGMFPSHFEHLQFLGEVDIALDTYPFNGCLTTLEGLWMGVPVVSLAGETLVSRVGLDLLGRVGLQHLAASTAEEFVDKAGALARDWNELAEIRVALRRRMAASTLCDTTAHAGSIEAAYRKMWHRWCRSQGVDVSDSEVESRAGSGTPSLSHETAVARGLSTTRHAGLRAEQDSL